MNCNTMWEIESHATTGRFNPDPGVHITCGNIVIKTLISIMSK